MNTRSFKTSDIVFVGGGGSGGEVLCANIPIKKLALVIGYQMVKFDITDV